MKNPFAGQWPGMKNVQAVDAESRKRMVAEFTAAECCAALELPGVQNTVVDAIKRRLKALGKAKGAKP